MIFLRNHDELTLEMVTDEERDYMYREYARDPMMRMNVGIRRRLAPLMENGRRQMELLNGLLLSMPGTPVIYYGDEIAMGDNVSWATATASAPRCSGASTATLASPGLDAARLYSPVIVESGLRLPGRERRGAASDANLISAVDAAHHPHPKAVQSVRTRQHRVPGSDQPAYPGVPPSVR